jgi:two-component system invasion response regulator UvrY
MIKIIIADDHPIVRSGMVQIINHEVDMKVVDECETGEELLSKVMDSDYDIVVLDIDLPGRNGIEILKEIKKIKPLLPVLILSSFDEQRYGVRAIQAGANSYLSKDENKNVIIESLRKIKGGKRYITAKLADVLAMDLDKTTDKPLHENLSDRELEIMRHIALGKPVSEIAELLSLSVNTVNTYRARVLSKMGMKSNTQLALYALENGLLDK